MKEKVNIPDEVKKRIKEVEMDNLPDQERPDGVGLDEVGEDIDKINPDMGTLDRG